LFGFLGFILDFLDLFCLYHSQLIGWKDSSKNDLLCIMWDVKLCSFTWSLIVGGQWMTVLKCQITEWLPEFIRH